MTRCQLRILFLAAALAASGTRSEGREDSEPQRLAREIFKELVEINTTDSSGSVTAAAEAVARRLRQAGFAEPDVRIAGPRENKKNLVVRYRGTGKRKPVLFLGHLDVVEARREDWTSDPFQFVEQGIQLLVGGLPKLAVVFEPLCGLGEWGGFELAGTPLSVEAA